MDWKDALPEIVTQPDTRIRFGEPLAKHTHFGIGGETTAYVEVSSIEELAALAHFRRKWEVPVAIIGRGSNLLVSDKGFKGISVGLINELAKLEVDGNVVAVGAGLSLPRLSKVMSKSGLSGVEFALGIPGSVGGALIMNAGAWGSSFGDVVTDVTVMRDTGELVKLTHAEANFEYRHSGLNAYFCVVGATLKLQPGDVGTITAEMKDFYKQKMETQPFTEENAGCMFKNPPGDSAGRLIDISGLKGHRIGGAEVSTIHGNFILNIDNATAADVLELVAYIQKQVREKTGISLQTEVKRLGFDE
ncbi:MAG: UDP-N-acetylmuramate dehydrogenase [Candidatus Poribacteria bacterium]|nr:UDP-N-acetylmuramate dehydrogenase [Candidatus Poribacteria bacterium]